MILATYALYITCSYNVFQRPALERNLSILMRLFFLFLSLFFLCRPIFHSYVSLYGSIVSISRGVINTFKGTLHRLVLQTFGYYLVQILVNDKEHYGVRHMRVAN